MSDVDIEVTESPEPTTPTVVVVEPSDTSDSVPSWGVDLIQRVTALELALPLVATAIETAQETADNATVAADVALSASDTAISVAIDAIDVAEETAEVVVATAEAADVLPEVIATTDVDMVPDVVPQQTHPLFRSASDWRQKIGGN